MEIDGYVFDKDENFTVGECYWVHKKQKLVGWLCMFCGIIRVTHCDTKEVLPSPFLVHELYGDEPVDEFPSGKARRAAFRKAVNALEGYYGDIVRPALSPVERLFGKVEEVDLSQLTQLGLF